MVSTGAWYKPGWKEKILNVDNYVNEEHYQMSHFKRTCPNPHSGESVHSQPIEGVILDPLTKNGLYVTLAEYELMENFTSDKVILYPEHLIPTVNILEKFRGFIAGMQFDL